MSKQKEVDSLIDELFPEGGPRAPGQKAPTTTKHSFDSSSDDEGGGPVDTKTTKVNLAKASKVAGAAPTKPAREHNFDDDSSDDSDSLDDGPQGGAAGRLGSGSPTGKGHRAGGVRPSTAQRNLYTVPFPTACHVGDDVVSCPSRCFVSNLGSTNKLCTPPTLASLVEVAEGKRDAGSTASKMMTLKGAFYVEHPKLGNGVLDNNGDGTADGGCPHMTCRKCNYVVVRLQGAEWCDADTGHGAPAPLNLYLTTRNYYPDWSRLAGTAPVGIDPRQAGVSSVLRPNPDAAAYCCQCSWLTVTAPRVIIDTRVTDTASKYAATVSADEHPFCTQLPATGDCKLRPPLWICSGHYL